jgi:hypothetical protein
MNNKGGAQICVLTGILSICLFLVPFFIQSYNIITSDENIASKCLVMFGVLCVVISLVFLVFFLVICYFITIAIFGHIAEINLFFFFFCAK